MRRWSADAFRQKRLDFDQKDGFIDDLAIAHVIKFMTDACLDDDDMRRQMYIIYQNGIEYSRHFLEQEYRKYNNYELVVYNLNLEPELNNVIEVTLREPDKNIPTHLYGRVVTPNLATLETGNLIHFDNDCVKDIKVIPEDELESYPY